MNTIEKARAKRDRSRPLQSVRAIAIFVAIAAVIVFFSMGMRRYDRLVGAGKRIGDRFSALAVHYPFQTPAAGTSPDPARLELMLSARAAMIAALPPGGDAIAGRLTAPEGWGDVKLARVLLEFGPEMEAPAMALAGALDQNHMSPLEYRWLLGVCVTAALKNPALIIPAGAAYQPLLAQLEKHGELEARLTTDFQNRFGGWPPPAPQFAQRLATPNRLGYLADLLVLTAREQTTR